MQPHRPREVNPAPASCKSKQMHQGACHPVITPLLFSTFRTALTAGHASRCRLNKHFARPQNKPTGLAVTDLLPSAAAGVVGAVQFLIVVAGAQKLAASPSNTVTLL